MGTRKRQLRVALESVLDLLDEGLHLYRRTFARMLVLASLLNLPVSALVATAVIAGDWLVTATGITLLLLGAVLGLPLSLYIMAPMSRAAVLAADGGTVTLRSALALGPLQLLGIGCYGTVFLLVAASAVSVISSVCFCVAYLFGVLSIAAFSSAGVVGGAAGEVVSAAGIVTTLVGVVLMYAATLVLNGAAYSSTIFALQPFVHERLPTGQAIRHGLDLTFYRFGQNLLTFVCASLVFGAIALAATLAIGVLVPLPIIFLLGAESLAARAITAAVWVGAVTVAIPLLPIWMALLYRHRLAAWQGAELRTRLAALM
ncbi:MAG: hypothetical protein SNJ69_12410 [Chloroflexaceae bacterium]